MSGNLKTEYINFVRQKIQAEQELRQTQKQIKALEQQQNKNK